MSRRMKSTVCKHKSLIVTTENPRFDLPVTMNIRPTHARHWEADKSHFILIQMKSRHASICYQLNVPPLYAPPSIGYVAVVCCLCCLCLLIRCWWCRPLKIFFYFNYKIFKCTAFIITTVFVYRSFCQNINWLIDFEPNHFNMSVDYYLHGQCRRFVGFTGLITTNRQYERCFVISLGHD